MEFCNGGGLIDFMNTRLQQRLTEPEILKIFSDVAEGVACMHYLKPPLLHRDSEGRECAHNHQRDHTSDSSSAILDQLPLLVLPQHLLPSAG
jgi:serine/threonine protein kinase